MKEVWVISNVRQKSCKSLWDSMIMEFKEKNSYDVWMNNNYHPEFNLFKVHLHGKWIIIRCQAPGNIRNFYHLYAFRCFFMLHCFLPRKIIGNVCHILEKVHLKNWTPNSTRISEISNLFNIFHLIYNFRPHVYTGIKNKQ